MASSETRSNVSYSSFRRERSVIRSVSIRTWDDAQSILKEEAPEIANPCLAIPDKCRFIYQDPDSLRTQAQHCPRVTLNLFQQGWEAQEFDTELGEPQKKILPAYYYQASRSVRGKSNRGSNNQRIHSAQQQRSQTPIVTSRKAFASPVNNKPIYYPEYERNGKHYPVFVTPTSASSHQSVLSASDVQISITH